MAKRRLTKNQSRRIRARRAQKATSSPADTIDENALGVKTEGRVVAHFGAQVEVESLDKTERRRCYVRATVDALVTGDYVFWRPYNDEGVVIDSQPRNTTLSRPDSFGNLKAVAANIDRIVLVIAPKPACHRNLIDRYLVAAECQRIPAIVVINKCEMIDESHKPEFDEIEQQYSQLDYSVRRVSTKTGAGLDVLRADLAPFTSVFVGQSGVGKSSILNQLIPDRDIAVGSLSEAKAKGRHTTTHAELFHLPGGGECIDSPGIREFGLWHLDENEVMAGFRDLRQFAGECRFRDCKHRGDPGCKIEAAVDSGEIEASRFDSYRRIIAGLDAVDVRSTDEFAND